MLIPLMNQISHKHSLAIVTLICVDNKAILPSRAEILNVISVQSWTTTVDRNVLVCLLCTGNLAAVTILSYLSITISSQFNVEGTCRVGFVHMEFDFSMNRYGRLGVDVDRHKTEISLMSITKTRGVEVPS